MRETSAPVLHAGIIGGGPRGLVILERLTHYSLKYHIPLVVYVLDPGPPGCGVHFPQQPEYKMLNTVAGQITLFPDEHMLSHSEECHPVCTFLEWCQQNKTPPAYWYQMNRHEISGDDFLPRRWLGEYLRWAYNYIVTRAGEKMSVRHLSAVASDISLISNDSYQITLSSGETLSVDAVYLTSGHGVASVNDEIIPPEESVLLQGMGLTAMDIIADWTVGRGGKFSVSQCGEPAYVASGREPQIYLTSQSGLPFRCRPELLSESGHSATDPVIFRTERIVTLKEKCREGIDFESQVLPLIRAEMRAAYYTVKIRKEAGVDKAQCFRNTLRRADSWPEIGGILENAASLYGVFNEWTLLISSLPADIHPDNYSGWFVSHIKEDLAESASGLLHSPVKAACEVWRNCRNQLRVMMDDGGLSERSNTQFYARYAPVINRLVAGPQKERHQELLALIKAGIVHPVHPCSVDTHSYRRTVQARIFSEQPGKNVAPLMHRLAEKGLLTLKTTGRCYAEVRSDGHPSGQQSGSRFWIFGPQCEGATYYNHYVPSPGTFSRFCNDADLSTRELLFSREQDQINTIPWEGAETGSNS